MEEKYKTLKVLYSIVKDSLHPTSYSCMPNEIIVHHYLSWDVIISHLKELAEEKLILLPSPGIVMITQKGIEKADEREAAVA